MELTDCFYGNQDTPITITSTLSPWPPWQLAETGQEMSIHVSVFVARMSHRRGRERRWRHSTPTVWFLSCFGFSAGAQKDVSDCGCTAHIFEYNKPFCLYAAEFIK